MPLRVYELSKRIDIPSKAIVEELKKLQLQKTHMSSLTEEETNLVLWHYLQKFKTSDLSPILSSINNETTIAAEDSKSELAEKETKNATKEESKISKKENEETKKLEQPNNEKVEKKQTVSKKNQERNISKKATPKIEKETDEQNLKSKKKSALKIPLSPSDENEKDIDLAKDIESNKTEILINTKVKTIDPQKFSDEEKIEKLINTEDESEKKIKKTTKKTQKDIQPSISKTAVDKKEEKKDYFEIEIEDSIVVSELSKKMNKPVGQVIKSLISFGIMANTNQTLDYDTASIIVEDFGGKAIKKVKASESSEVLENNNTEDPNELKPRPPVIVVMGHVDHGKTTVLDVIRSTNVASKESGGITQHIGAYEVEYNGQALTFLDTPGHEAFTAMRARGARATDIVILVVAADDGVMPQTKEAINHAKEANVPIIVAVNKIDKENANPDRVKQQLVDCGLVPEEWGGDNIFVEISARNGTNIEKLLEMILLVSEVMELKANPDRDASGTVIESYLDKFRGPVATLLVQKGTLKMGDMIIAGSSLGKIRAMVNHKGEKIKKAPPSAPVEIVGISDVCTCGAQFYVIKDERKAKKMVEDMKLVQKQKSVAAFQKVSLGNLYEHIESGKMKELNIVVKTDVQGSAEVMKSCLEQLSNKDIRVKVIHGMTGAISESDVMLALASRAMIIGFNVRPTEGALTLANSSKISIKTYKVLYDAVEDVKNAIKGMFDPVYKELVIGHAEIRNIFKASNIGNIAGVYVTDGKIERNNKVRVIRDGILVYEGELASLKRFKDDTKEVRYGYECGLNIDKFNDIKVGDIIESYAMVKDED